MKKGVDVVKKGLDKIDIKSKLHEKLDSNPDLKYYIDNEYVTKLIDLLIEGIAEVMEENNKELVEDLFKRGLRLHHGCKNLPNFK